MLEGPLELAARPVTVTCLALHVTVTPSGMSRKRVPKMVFMTAALSLHLLSG